MSGSITVKLNKAASVFQAGESTGFGLRGGVRYYDRETGQNEYTNYEWVAFAKAPGQVEFYKNAFVEGSIVEVSYQQQKIKSFEGQNGTMLSIELIDAKVGYIGTVGNNAPNTTQNSGNQQHSAQNNTQQQRQPQQRPAPQPQQNAASKMYGDKPAQGQPPAQNFTPDLDEGWDSDIPF